jgi:hypothetical protein
MLMASDGTKKTAKKETNPLFEKRSKTFGIGKYPQSSFNAAADRQVAPFPPSRT